MVRGILCLAKVEAYQASGAAAPHVMGSRPYPLTRRVVHRDIPWSSKDNQAQTPQRRTLHVGL